MKKTISTIILSFLVCAAAAVAQLPAVIDRPVLSGNPKPAATPTPAPTPSPTPAAALNVTGKWALSVDANGQTVEITMELKQTGAEFSGTTTSDIGNGKIDGGKVSEKAVTATLHADVQGQAVDFKMEGTVNGDKMTGTFSNASFGGLPFSATKNK